MKTQLRNLFAASILAFAASAGAQGTVMNFIDGNEMLSRLNSPVAADTLARRAVALGYVLGVIDAARGSEGKYYCTPNNMTAGQARDVVHAYLVNNPTRRHESASNLIIAAMIEAFPCAQQTPSNNRGQSTL